MTRKLSAWAFAVLGLIAVVQTVMILEQRARLSRLYVLNASLADGWADDQVLWLKTLRSLKECTGMLRHPGRETIVTPNGWTITAACGIPGEPDCKVEGAARPKP